MEEYGSSVRFSKKIPKKKGTRIQKRGDNAYRFKKIKRQWEQLWCYHGPDQLEHDISGKNVLIGREFYYFGWDAVEIPDRFRSIIKKGPGHKCNFSEKLVKDFINWLKKNHRRGRNNLPFHFKKGYRDACRGN